MNAHCRLRAAIPFGLLLLLIGCVTERQQQQSSIQLVEARTSTGLITDEASDVGLAKLQAALDQWEVQRISAALIDERVQDQPAANPTTQTSEQNKPKSADVSNAEPLTPPENAAPKPNYPANAGRMIPLTRISLSEIRELIESVEIKLQTENGYSRALPTEHLLLPSLPEGIAESGMLSRHENDGTTRFLRFGFRTFTSQLPQLMVYGLTKDAKGTFTLNPDVDLVKPIIDATTAEITKLRAGLTGADLDREIIKLSYIDAANASKILKALGINAQANLDAVPDTLNFDQLPMVAALPAAPEAEIGVVGGGAQGGNKWGGSSMIPTEAGKLSNFVNAAPTNQLLIVFHPAHPEQLSRVRRILRDYVDRPARQIFVEGMVLEISEDGLDDLGVQWNFADGSFAWMLGSLEAGGVFDTFGFTFDDRVDAANHWSVTLRALVRDGKAEVLSRPSVLTLDGRQAAIRVGEDIPIATSQEGTNVNSNKVSFSFNYLPVGILLNVRPTMSQDEKEVSMLIDTTVSSVEPGLDLEIRSRDGELLASAPTVASRRVQTYGRIRNKTPFIIGGLVSRDRVVIKDKVPLIGDIPILGMAFRSEKTTTKKREVIIVLTPFILPEETAITPSLPKDDDVFDRTGNQLFRDAYRIRAEDVFDLSFLFQNRRLVTFQKLANRVLDANFRMAAVPPFSDFVGGRIPGEDILVDRMIYEVVKRTNIDDRVNPKRIIYLNAKETEGYHVQFLDRMLGELGGGDNMASFFVHQPGKAVTITYNYDRESMEVDKLATEPLPEINVVDCPDRDAWQQILWDLNQPTDEGMQRFTIVINNEDDIERLQRAIMLKRIITLNGGESALTVKNFTVGRLLAIPQLKDDQVTVIDSDVARYFFHTELYYRAAIKKIAQSLEQLELALRRPDIQPYLNGDVLPPKDDNEPIIPPADK